MLTSWHWKKNCVRGQGYDPWNCCSAAVYTLMAFWPVDVFGFWSEHNVASWVLAFSVYVLLGFSICKCAIPSPCEVAFDTDSLLLSYFLWIEGYTVFKLWKNLIEKLIQDYSLFHFSLVSSFHRLIANFN